VTDAPFVAVREVMTVDPASIDGMATVSEAVAAMRANEISSLVVSRRDERDEYGIVLIADIAREIINKNRSASRTNVYEVMTKPAPTLDANMNIRYAIRHMISLGFSHAVVLHGRELAGVVTLRDMTLRYIEATERTTG
jgi:CBS domain-containing protein